jgi:hypothetical protein
MKRAMRTLGLGLALAAPVFGLLFLALGGAAFLAAPLPALAQADSARDLAPELSWWPAAADALPPAEILDAVRRQGFHPVSRPVQRERVYVLFAVDQDDMEVKLTVDAATGGVLWGVAAVAHFGGPGHFGYPSVWRSHPLGQANAARVVHGPRRRDAAAP